jgi:hypothetical protein
LTAIRLAKRPGLRFFQKEKRAKRRQYDRFIL